MWNYGLCKLPNDSVYIIMSKVCPHPCIQSSLSSKTNNANICGRIQYYTVTQQHIMINIYHVRGNIKRFVTIIYTGWFTQYAYPKSFIFFY